MRVKPWVAFTTDLPDDQIEDGQDIALFGGRNVAVAIGELLAELGCVVEEPYYAELDGWEFLLTYKGRHRFWCRVTSFHPAFLLLFQNYSILPGAGRSSAAYRELAVLLAAALEEHPRFRDVTWWTFEEGPPEPDEIGRVRSGKERSDDARRPIAIGGKRVFVPAWIWLILGVFMLLDAAITLHSEFRAAERDANEIAFGLLLLSVGGLALRTAIRRGVFK